MKLKSHLSSILLFFLQLDYRQSRKITLACALYCPDDLARGVGGRLGKGLGGDFYAHRWQGTAFTPLIFPFQREYFSNPTPTLANTYSFSK